MMDQSYFHPLLDAAELLGNTKTHDLLLQMQSVYQQKLYFVAFIGQYSAGKSCLLNRLLKRQLLPEGTTETTPLLTYIRYGEREEAKLHYMDGAIRILDLDQVAQLTQQGACGRWDLDQLEFLEIYLRENMLRSGMILLDTPGINTLIERHERLLEASLSMAASIIYVAGHAPSLVDVDKLSMLTDAGFDVSFVRTHCDEIKVLEETLEQVKAADQASLAKCEIGPEQCYYVSNCAGSALFAALDPLRDMLMEKGNRASIELETNIERQLLVQAEQCRVALENRRTLLKQAHEKNAESVKEHHANIRDKIKRLESQLQEAEASMRKRIESCRKTLQRDIKQQLEGELQRARDSIANATVTDETEMTTLLRQKAATFFHDAYRLINASLDPLVQGINGELSVGDITLDPLSLPQISNYQKLRVDQDELIIHLRSQLKTLQASQTDLIQALAAKEGSAEYLQLQKELQELQAALVEIQQERADLPPYVPQMLEDEDGRIQPSQIARSIGAAADWAMLLIPGAQIESALVKVSQVPQVAKTMGKFVGILEKTGEAAKKGDTIKDVLFTLKNLSEHTRTSARRERIAKDTVTKLAEGVGAGQDALRKARQKNDSASILDLLTIEYWVGKLGEQFDRPPHLVVDQEYEARYKEVKRKLAAEYREQQQKAYQKKLELGLLQEETERFRAEEASLRIEQEFVAKELTKRETELRTAAQQEALKKWRRDCADWYRNEVKRRLEKIIDFYTEDFPVRLEEYQRQHLQALRDALEKEQISYNELKNASEDEISLELQRVNELLESMNDVFYRRHEAALSS